MTLPPVVSGCLSNNDCPDYTACQSRKCINPCAAPNVCAPNANCRVTRHQAVCTCPDGYIGSPQISCSLRKCVNAFSSNDICIFLTILYFRPLILKYIHSKLDKRELYPYNGSS